jgi:hypothetical protein
MEKNVMMDALSRKEEYIEGLIFVISILQIDQVEEEKI